MSGDKTDAGGAADSRRRATLIALALCALVAHPAASSAALEDGFKHARDAQRAKLNSAARKAGIDPGTKFAWLVTNRLASGASE